MLLAISIKLAFNQFHYLKKSILATFSSIIRRTCKNDTDEKNNNESYTTSDSVLIVGE